MMSRSEIVNRVKAAGGNHEGKANGSMFKVGDMITLDNPSEMYVVKECIEIHADDGIRYVYDVMLPSLSDSAIRCNESEMIYQWYDSNMADYFNESVRNGLPPWRGNLYNYDMFYIRSSDDRKIGLDESLIKDYNNDTIPPDYMHHILESHSIYYRIDDVLSKSSRRESNRGEIMNRLGISKIDVRNLELSIKSKIEGRNSADIDESLKRDIGESKHRKFTDLEFRFMSEIDLLDKKYKEGEERFKDHYPVEMTNLQIMEAIRDAYGNARKIKARVLQVNKDKRTGKKTDPVEGQQLYEGYSRMHDLVIQFWYNFDLDLIETAYPIRMNNNSRKH